MSGGLQQTLDSTTTFTLTAYGKSGAVSAQVTVEVKFPLPAIIYFTADPPEIWQGTASTLSWATVNAARCELLINRSNPEMVACNGRRQVTPLVTANYALVAYNGANESTFASIPIKVK